MLRRLALTLTIICGLLVAPLAMAGERATPSDGAVATSHCAQDSGQPDDRAPPKQFRCMGACFGVEADVLRLPPRLAAPRIAAAIPVAATLTPLVIEHEPPPPRLV